MEKQKGLYLATEGQTKRMTLSQLRLIKAYTSWTRVGIYVKISKV
jgi:hypothetical protein